jgi:hypothetical protein
LDLVSMLILTVVSPSAGMLQSAPGGLGYLSEVFEAGRLRDDISHRQNHDAWISASIKKLQRRHPKRIQVRWVDPHSLMGLYLVVRFRLKKFPVVLAGSRPLDPGDDPQAFEALITEILSQPDN